jgi:hypothetical protein
MSQFILTIVENNTSNFINLINENYMKYLTIKVENSFDEFDNTLEKKNMPLRNISYDLIPCTQ